MPRRPFSQTFLKSSLPLLFKIKPYQNRLLLKHSYVYCRLSFDKQLRAWAHQQSAYPQLSPLYLLSTLYITHMINYSRPSPAFHTASDGMLGRAWERGYSRPTDWNFASTIACCSQSIMAAISLFFSAPSLGFLCCSKFDACLLSLGGSKHWQLQWGIAINNRPVGSDSFML